MKTGQGDNPDRVIAALLRQRPVLAELRELFPSHWETVHAELRQLAAIENPAEIAGKLTLAHRAWQQVEPDCRRLAASFNRHTADRCGLHLLRRIALDQYCRALQRELLGGGVAGLRDRLLFHLLILPLATRPRALPCRVHRLAWRLLRNPAAVSAMLLEAGCYLIPPAELVDELRRVIGMRRTLEIGAGRGILAGCLRHAGVDIAAVDDQSWEGTIPTGRDVLVMDGREALIRFDPQVVLCSWPPPGNSFEREILAHPTVEMYIAILSSHRYASGDHQAYARAVGFRLLKAQTGPMAEMLLPPEAHSVLYLFMRDKGSGKPVEMPATDPRTLP
jgi:hypothetical protein